MPANTIEFQDANPTTGFTDDHFRHPYDLYALWIDYPRHGGQLQIPVASADPDTPSEIVTVSAPFSQKRVRWTARRIGEQPVIPDPTPLDPNEVLLTQNVTPQAPTLQPDGVTRVYSVAGEYVYALKRPRRPTGSYPTPKVPYDSGSKEANTLDEGHLVNDLA